ncbi:hypothetical protein SB5_13105, partial [Pseudomonas oryzihabitans]
RWGGRRAQRGARRGEYCRFGDWLRRPDGFAPGLGFASGFERGLVCGQSFGLRVQAQGFRFGLPLGGDRTQGGQLEQLFVVLRAPRGQAWLRRGLFLRGRHGGCGCGCWLGRRRPALLLQRTQAGDLGVQFQMAQVEFVVRPVGFAGGGCRRWRGCRRSGGRRFRRGQGRCLVGGVEHFQADAAPHVTVRSGQMFLGDAEASMAMRALGDERIGHGEATAREFKRASVPEGPGERSASARPPGERLGGGTTA